MSSVIDLSLLPAPDVIKKLDYEAIFAAMLETLKEFDPAFSAFAESDPAYKILQVAALYVMRSRAETNDAALATMLAYATGSDLDQRAASYNIQRKTITEADPKTTPPTEAVMESDADLRLRCLLALNARSTAGASDSYKHHAMKIEGVADAKAIMYPKEGHVTVSILANNNPDGSYPNEGSIKNLVSQVESALSEKYVRPLTDFPHVQAAAFVDFSIKATLYFDVGPDIEVVKENAKATLDTYLKEHFHIGHDIPLSGIYAALHQAGVQRVEITSPSANVLINDMQVARCTRIEIIDGGFAE